MAKALAAGDCFTGDLISSRERAKATPWILATAQLPSRGCRPIRIGLSVSSRIDRRHCSVRVCSAPAIKHHDTPRGIVPWYRFSGSPSVKGMKTFLMWLQFLALSLWLGADVFLSFVVAPGAFRILPSRDQAGGIVAGLVFLAARVIRARSFASLATPAAICVAFMIVFTAISQSTISPRMAALRTQMGSIEATSSESPLLAAFTRLHAVSVTLESAVLLAGFVALYFLVRQPR